MAKPKVIWLVSYNACGQSLVIHARIEYIVAHTAYILGRNSSSNLKNAKPDALLPHTFLFSYPNLLKTI